MGRSPPFSDRPLRLFILVGIPGSGKSTWARAYLADHPHYCLVSTDQIRAELYGDEAVQGDWQKVWQQVLIQWQRGIEQVLQGQIAGVVYDATNACRDYRQQACATARALGFNLIILIWFDVPLELALPAAGLASAEQQLLIATRAFEFAPRETRHHVEMMMSELVGA